MMACDVGVGFKLVELILCLVCLVYKRYSDSESLQTFLYLKKMSREWPFLNNITWNENGALLADVTFGGFTVVVLGLLVGQLTGELQRTRRMNCFFMVVGCIMFLIVGGLCLAAIDQVPHPLVDNAIILGILSLVTALLFLIDLALTGNKKRPVTTSSAKDKKPVSVISNSQSTEKPSESKKGTEKVAAEATTKKHFGNGVIKELRSSLKKKKSVDLDGRGVVVDKPDRNVEFENNNDPVEEVDAERGPRSFDDSKQYGRRRMDNRGFSRASDDSGRFSGDRFRDDFVDAERDERFNRGFDRFDSRNVSVVEGAYEGRRAHAQTTKELGEHYPMPHQDYYIERRVAREERRVQDQRVSSSRQDFSDDDVLQAQLPSVSYLLSERGRKVLPSLSTSPLERLHDATTSSANGKPRYYYNAARDPASGSSAPPSPRNPGYVLQTVSQWDKELPHQWSRTGDALTATSLRT